MNGSRTSSSDHHAHSHARRRRLVAALLALPSALQLAVFELSQARSLALNRIFLAAAGPLDALAWLAMVTTIVSLIVYSRGIHKAWYIWANLGLNLAFLILVVRTIFFRHEM